MMVQYSKNAGLNGENQLTFYTLNNSVAKNNNDVPS